MVIEVSKYLASSNILRGVRRCTLPIASSSYIIYLFHTTFEGFAKSLFHKFSLVGINAQLFVVEAFVVVFVGVAVPMLLHHFVLLRHKATRWAFGL